MSHGKLQGPRAPRKLLPGRWDLVDGKALPLVRHPQEQEYRFHPAGQPSLAAPPGDHRELRRRLLLFHGCVCHSVLCSQNTSRKTQRLEEQFNRLIFNSCTRLYVKATNRRWLFSWVDLGFALLCPPGMLLEQFAANGPRLQLYNLAEKHWEDLMNWQHATMYLFFGLAGTVCLIIHTTEAAPLALDRLMLAIAFFNEGRRRKVIPCSLYLDVKMHVPTALTDELCSFQNIRNWSCYNIFTV